MNHYRKTKHSYVRLNHLDTKSAVCTLCNEENMSRIVYQNDTMFVLPNRVAYDVFEGRRVLDHLMVAPKRHAESIYVFTNEEKLDFATIIGEYEAKGYNIYARSVDSSSRSVRHQHTHLIKLDHRKVKLMVFAQKPYFLLKV